jgi:hypothetical protein
MALTAWYYNSNTGAVDQLPTAVGWGELHSGLGWHGPFNSKQDALDYYTNGKAANPGWKAPAGIPSNIINGIGTAASDAIHGPASAAHEILGGVDITGWFVRIGEVLLGLVLLGVGVAKLTGSTNVIAKAVKAKL